MTDREQTSGNDLRHELWEPLWASGVAPGQYFDALQSLPELIHQVKHNQLPAGERALIPGCGRGYDIELLSTSGLFKTVIGVDISRTAVDTALMYLSEQPNLIAQNYDVLVADFFTLQVEPVDLVYDYTFFCAIPPELRPKWGDTMRRLIKKGGSLITVMFPMAEGKADLSSGPPFQVSVAEYKKVLDGFQSVDGPRKLEDAMCHPRREGRTWWCRWQRVE